MEKIESFTIDYMRLKQGLYVNKIYKVGYEYITIFDIRMKKPYDIEDPIMTTGSIHAIEHLGKYFLNNDELWKNKIIYFGPMGSRTGFNLIVEGEVDTEIILPLIDRMFDFISDYEGDIPNCSPKECGNYIDIDINEAKRDAAIYYNVLVDAKKTNFNYPKPRESKK